MIKPIIGILMLIFPIFSFFYLIAVSSGVEKPIQVTIIIFGIFIWIGIATYLINSYEQDNDHP